MIQTIINNMDNFKESANSAVNFGSDSVTESAGEFTKVFEEKYNQETSSLKKDVKTNDIENLKISKNSNENKNKETKTLESQNSSLVDDLKKADFEKKTRTFIGSLVTEIQENSENNSTVTIQGLLNSLQNNVLTQDLEAIKEVLDKALLDANTENSLDLTLSKDVEDIISQIQDLLQEFSGDIEELDEVKLEELAALISQLMENADSLPKLPKELEPLFESVEKLYSQIKSYKGQETESLLSFKNTENQETQIFETEITEYSKKVVNSQPIESEENDSELSLDEDMLKDLNIESIKSEVETSGGDLMQNQTAQEQGVKAMLVQDGEYFDTRIEKTVNVQNSSNPQPQQIKTVDVTPSRIIEQVSKQLEALQNGSRINMVLNPGNLGKVNIQLMATKDGLMAQFTVTTAEARDILMKGLDGLKETLVSQGVGVDNVSVKLSEPEKSSYEQDWTEQEGSNGGNKGQDNLNREEKEKGAFEQMLAQITNDSEENGKV